MNASEPGVIAAGAGALPRARRRCEAGKRTHGPGPRACLALLAAAALALGVAENAAAQTTLVSNVVETSGVAHISFTQEAAQAFTTGATGATVSSVEIISSDTQGDDFDLSLCATSANDRPTSTCTELTAPSSFAAGTLVFTAPANTTLDPTTTYAVLMTPESASVTVPGLGSNDEDTGGAMGWTIADTHQFTNAANDWRTSTPGGGRSMRIAIKGTLTASANTAAMGAPTITGTAQVDQTLTAVTTGITDADGLTSPTYTYQWIRVDGTDEEDISGENSSTYTLVDADLGKTIKVKVSFTDDASNAETLTSAATVTVAADTTPPEVESVTVPISGSEVELVFDEDLDELAGDNLLASVFSLTVAGQAVTIPDYAIREAVLILTVQTGTIKQGQTVVLSYTDPTASDDTVALQDIAGNDVASFTTGMSGVPAVTNDSTVAATNTPPTAADNTVTTGEDRPYAFMAGDFRFDDTDTGDTLASVKIVAPPALGTLALDGTAVLADGVVTKTQIDGDMLTFRPAQDAHGAPYTTFTFKVNDGTVDSADAYTMTIDVTDAPLPVCGPPDFGTRRQIWTGTLTVEEFSFLGSVSGYGFDPLSGISSLLPSAEFSIGSNNNTIAALGVVTAGDLYFNVGTLLTATEEAALRLHVCDEDLDFSVALNDTNNPSYVWAGTLDWSPPVTTRTLYLSLPANNAATGGPAITGTAQAGQELTADASPIMDTDGVPSSFTYQWVRVDADGTSNEEDITGEIAETYTLTTADVGKKVKVKVSFTDELSGVEMRTSAAYPSSGTVTASANTTAPALLSVTVTSTPHKTTDTYGAREHIEFSMTFDAPVTVTGAPTFAFDLGGASTATWYAGSGTTTLRFSHAVSGGSSGDRDTNGISWAENAIALNGGTIAGRDNAVAAVLTHAAQSNLAAHKVDGRTTAVTAATVTVAVTSTPTSLADTYGFGETIVITVTASEAVEVVGDPEFEFSLTDLGGAANDPPATYDRTRSSRDDDRIHLHGAGGRPGQQRHLDRQPQPNLHAGRERPHPHGLAADRHRPQPSREGHVYRPQGGRIPGGADRTAGSHGADPGVGHRHDAHHRVDAPG